MRTDILAEFADLAQTLNYTETSKRCHVTQPALSKHILSLEKELGVRLFTRDTRHVQLTEIGAALVFHAQAVVESATAMEQTASTWRRGVSETLRIGYLRMAAEQVIPLAHKRFKEVNPQVSVHYIPYSYYGLVHAMDDDAIDMAIGCRLADQDDEVDPSFTYVDLFNDDMKLVVPETNTLFSLQKDSVRADDLNGATFLIVPEDEPFSGEKSLLAFLQERNVQVSLLEEFKELETLPLQLATEGCVAYLPSHLTRFFEEAPMGTFRFFTLEGFSRKRHYGIMWKKSNQRTGLEEYARVFAKSFKEFHRKKNPSL